jgi:hypothetical protein
MLLPLVTKSKLDSFYVWTTACGLLSVLLLFTPLLRWLQSLELGVAWLGLFGLVYAVSNSVPYALVVAASPAPNQAGALLGLLNVAICLPQVVTSMVGGPMHAQFHSDVPCFLLGGLCAAGAARVLYLRWLAILQAYEFIRS